MSKMGFVKVSETLLPFEKKEREQMMILLLTQLIYGT